jgi:hypothetical protein
MEHILTNVHSPYILIQVSQPVFLFYHYWEFMKSIFRIVLSKTALAEGIRFAQYVV